MKFLKENTILNRNQYRIIKLLGSGGFGITYLAEEVGYYRYSGFGEQYTKHRTPDKVVIKELFYDDFCTRDENTGLITISNGARKTEFQKLVRNQLDEGKIIKSLDHPNIVKTRDIFEENGTAYMVMDHIESIDLAQLLQNNGKLSVEKSIKYILEILDAASYFHTGKNKILHLDIAPNNILISKKDDKAILIDFGASLLYNGENDNKVESSTSQIVTGRKKHYSPNEQSDLDSLKVFNPTFDTYAIGATLYHLLTGIKPQLSSNLISGREEFKNPSEYIGVSDRNLQLDKIVRKAMSPKYDERYKSASDFSDALNILKTNINDDDETELLGNSKIDTVKDKGDATVIVNIDENRKEEQNVNTKVVTDSNVHKDKSKNKNNIFIIAGIVVVAFASFFIFKFNNKPNQENFPSKESTSEIVVFEENGLFGYKIGDSVIINPRFEFAAPFVQDEAKVTVNDSTYIINSKNKIVEIIKLPANNNQTLKPEVNQSVQHLPEKNSQADITEKSKPKEKIVQAESTPVRTETKTETVPAPKPKQEIFTPEYTSNLNFAKRMINANGIDKCKANPDCKGDVIESLNEALKYSQGSEAKELLNKMKN